jgi:hypothetical protein
MNERIGRAAFTHMVENEVMVRVLTYMRAEIIRRVVWLLIYNFG